MLTVPVVENVNSRLPLLRMTWIIVYCGVLLLTIPQRANAATFEVDPQKCIIDLQGEIDAFTDADLINRYKSLNNKKCSVTLRLHSPGGDINAALRAGEIVRQNSMTTVVPRNASCASACVLLFLGGNLRMSFGSIGLHRPFSTKYSSSMSESKTTYQNINQSVRDYLTRMNIPEGLLNIMNSVPPSEIKWLTVDDDKVLSELQITGVDPVYADRRDSALAQRLGISKQEYYAREQKVYSICASATDAKQLAKCTDDVMNGLR